MEVMISNIVVKKEVPGAFIIPWTTRVCKFGKPLCDLSDGINLM